MTSEHERPHGGALPPGPPGHDAVHWDARYAQSERLWSPSPNATIAEIVGPMHPARAVDVGAGEGRHAVWLAALGWTVTAVDFSDVGISRGRFEAESRGIPVEWVVADVREWAPPAGTTYDLVLVAYLHLEGDVFSRTRDWLAPDGRLVVLGHARRNLTDGVGGPQDPRLLHTEEQLRAAADGLQIERLGEVMRPTPEGDAVDIALVARRTTRS